MELKVFGKSIFEFKDSRGALLFESASSSAKESKYLPDFYKGGRNEGSLSDYVVLAQEDLLNLEKAPKKRGRPKQEIQVTPKGVFEMRLLHDETFELKTDPEYVDQQISDFKDKLNLIKAEEYDMRRGVEEISSILLRFENRKKYPEEKEFFEQFAYTTTSKIDELVKNHKHLKCGQIAQFIADMPKEAVEVMKQYDKHTDNLCGKKAVYYIIADQKDFKSTNNRRDPILLAQSPFGHCWQILGAWDKEMLFLEEL